MVEYTRRFDAPRLKLSQLKVSPQEISAAQRTVGKAFVRTMNRAITQIHAFHQRQVQNSWFDTQRSGTYLGQIVRPVDGAGIYVPGGQGGTTPLVSSVLMGAIPAKVAGVARIAMVTPPMKDGSINPFLLTAAKKVGVTDIYRIGSAWAIAALAYGTQTVPAVDVIAGPGNLYVTIAKKIVAGTVGIDMIAGPSEILVIADDSVNPEYAAADLLSQAEHDPMASSVLITDSRKVARAVAEAVGRQVLKLERRKIAEESIKRFGAILVVPDLSDAVALANRIAPEHLELQVTDPFSMLGQIRNAGAVFMGHYTPEPVGDYFAGPNHVLPTAGTARFSSALSVEHFTKKTSVIHYSKGAFKKEAKDIMRLSEVEGLGAHTNSVKVRLKP